MPSGANLPYLFHKSPPFIVAILLVTCAGCGDSNAPSRNPFLDAGEVEDGVEDTRTGGTDAAPEIVDNSCQTDDDCSSDRRCAGDTCVLRCGSDDDCAAPTGACERESGRCVVCADNDDCSGRDAICDTTVFDCVECLDATTCGPGAECVEGGCVPQCRTADDCEDELRCIDQLCQQLCGRDDECADDFHCEGQVCTPDCTGDDSCADNEACQLGRCIPACQTDEECGGDDQCIQRVCRPPCTNWEECGLGYTCDEGFCFAVELVCEPDATSCEDNTVVRCTPDGLENRRFECAENQVCLPLSGAAACVSNLCTAGETGCFDRNTSWACAADGSRRIASECEEGLRCVDSVCQPPINVPCLDVTDTLDFGPLQPALTRQRRLFIRNCGEVSFDVPTFEVTGEAFELTGELPTGVVTPGETRMVRINFTSANPGEELGEVIITGPDPEIPDATVVLRGLTDPAAPECLVPVAGCRDFDRDPDGDYANAITVDIDTVIECDSRGSEESGDIDGFAWYFDPPEDDQGFILLAGGNRADFYVNREGTYRIELDLVGNFDDWSCLPASVAIVVEDPEEEPPTP